MNENMNTTPIENAEKFDEALKDLPGNVLFTTAEGGTIRLCAVNDIYYYKEYYAATRRVGVDRPYKAKTVKLPVNRDGIAFCRVEEYFKYLLEKCGYRKE